MVCSSSWTARSARSAPTSRCPTTASRRRPSFLVWARSPPWRTLLRGYLPLLVAHQPVLDLRSTDYAAMWPVTGPLRRQVVPVRVLTARGRGRSEVRRALSYQAKVGKGRLVRALLEAGALTQGHDPSVTPGRLAHAVSDAAAELGYRPEVRRGAADQVRLDLVGRA